MYSLTQSYKTLMFNQQQLYHMFQPIYNISNHYLYGYEALLRSPLANPEYIFSIASKNKQLYELDWFSIKLAILTFFQSSMSTKEVLYVNIYPSTLCHSSFLKNLTNLTCELDIPIERIVFEIIESEDIEDLIKLKEIIHNVKSMGFRFALDDIGKGKSSLSTITMVEPEVIKLDRWFSKDLSQSIGKQNCLKRMVSFCSDDIILILEGIEQQNDLTVAQSLGILFGQGNFLGEPGKLYSSKVFNLIT